jgi:speckle-type POZ protein
MERLKLLCEEKVCGDISVGTAATQLVLAEQHGCPKLKAMCMEFMGRVDFSALAGQDSEPGPGQPRPGCLCTSLLFDFLAAVKPGSTFLCLICTQEPGPTINYHQPPKGDVV